MPGPRPLRLLLRADMLPLFFSLLQQGVMVRVPGGCSVGMFLRDLLCLDERFIRERIATVLLDGRPVDDLDSAILRNESCLALSGALPGLVGAVMRREGLCSPMRSSLTYQESALPAARGESVITLKLFNVLLGAMGPDLLSRGVLVRASRLMALVREHRREIEAGSGELLLDGERRTVEVLCSEGALQRDEVVVLSVAAAGR
ncbi:MAG: hypothetical protein AB1805_09965 [Nitrospirota bacterium]